MKILMSGFVTAMSGLCLLVVNANAADDAIPGTILDYVEKSEDLSPVTTHFIANKDYLHISDDINPDDFILFKRSEQTIYVVTKSEKTVFVIKSKPVSVTMPIKLTFKEKPQDSARLPKVDGRQVTHYRYSANGEHCYDAAVLPGDFLPDVYQAMYEFKQVMAGEHATSMNGIPGSMINACDISLNIYHAGEYLKHGLPVQEWAPGGYQRYLKNYHLEATAPVSTFNLPEDYERYSVGDVLEKNAN